MESLAGARSSTMRSRNLNITIAALIGATLFTAAPAAMGAATASQPEAKATEKKVLKAGDRAPEFKVEKFIKGDAITGFEKGHVYVVEFWATWCGPCIKAFPHLTELQKQYAGDVTIIGTNIWETNKYDDSTLAKVEKFVAQKDDVMGYTVAYDGPSRHMDEKWMRAAGRNGIPSAFVVGKQGMIEWMGHPMWLDVVLAEVVADKWDAATGQSKLEAIETKLGEAFRLSRSDPAGAVAKFEEIEREYPSVGHMFEDTKAAWMMAAGDTKGASAIFAKNVDKMIASGDSEGLNAIAWGMVDPDSPAKNPDLDLALKAAEAADRLSDHKNPAIIDTLARVHFVKGDVAKAIELQTKAVGLASGEMKADLEKVLAEYKSKK